MLEIDDDNYLGKVAKDIPTEKIEELLKKGFSISPRSGRLRKKVKVVKEKKSFTKKKLRKSVQKAGWILLLIIFLISLVMIIPQLSDKNENRRNSQKSR